LGDHLSVAVFGAGGGIGKSFVENLAGNAMVGNIYAFSRSVPAVSYDRVTGHDLNIEDEASIEQAVEIIDDGGPLHLAIVASGMLHDEIAQPEKRARDLSAPAMEHVFRINTIGPALVAKHVLPRLARDRKTVFAALSARVGSISDNQLGGWHSYRASKAALNMLIRTHAIELAYRNPKAVCVALHPGTVDTGLSEPFQRNVEQNKLFTPDFAVDRMLGVLDGLTPADTGGFFAWDGQPIPF
jgi:NAD(P)-dependent dehydrogenase (short-subunit alcohol dehydrogenase family)